jgi:hypothetical protein
MLATPWHAAPLQRAASRPRALRHAPPRPRHHGMLHRGALHRAWPTTILPLYCT